MPLSHWQKWPSPISPTPDVIGSDTSGMAVTDRISTHHANELSLGGKGRAVGRCLTVCSLAVSPIVARLFSLLAF
jgi:hypothetical protein